MWRDANLSLITRFRSIETLCGRSKLRTTSFVNVHCVFLVHVIVEEGGGRRRGICSLVTTIKIIFDQKLVLVGYLKG